MVVKNPDVTQADTRKAEVVVPNLEDIIVDPMKVQIVIRNPEAARVRLNTTEPVVKQVFHSEDNKLLSKKAGLPNVYLEELVEPGAVLKKAVPRYIFSGKGTIP